MKKASIWSLGGLTWRELGRRVWRHIYDEGDIFTRAAALSYYFLLALFPLLLFLLAMLGYMAETGTELRRDLLLYLSQLIPRTASALIYTTIEEITEGAGGGKLSFGLVTAIWVASLGMAAITDTLNAAYGVRESRPYWRVRGEAILLTVALAIFIILSLALVLYGGEIGESIARRAGYGEVFVAVWSVARWPVVLACVLFAFALIYYFAPNLKEQKWYWITPGSVAGVVLWLLVSYAFRVYLVYFDTYSVTYGSLGAVIVLMLWFYLTGLAILVGGQVNAEIEHAAAEAGRLDAKLPGEKEAPLDKIEDED